MPAVAKRKRNEIRKPVKLPPWPPAPLPWGPRRNVVELGTYTFWLSVQFLIGLVIGGINTVAGAVIGGFLGNTLMGAPLSGFSLWSLVMAVIGALILLWVYRMTTKGKRVPLRA